MKEKTGNLDVSILEFFVGVKLVGTPLKRALLYITLFFE